MLPPSFSLWPVAPVASALSLEKKRNNYYVTTFWGSGCMGLYGNMNNKHPLSKIPVFELIPLGFGIKKIPRQNLLGSYFWEMLINCLNIKFLWVSSAREKNIHKTFSSFFFPLPLKFGVVLSFDLPACKINKMNFALPLTWNTIKKSGLWTKSKYRYYVSCTQSKWVKSLNSYFLRYQYLE